MRRIKVLQVIGALNMGGAETMIMNIFRNIDREKFDFHFYLCGNENGYYENEVNQLGGIIYNIGRRKKHPVKYIMALYSYIKNNNIDVVHIHATTALDGLAAVVARIAGVKKVCLFSHCSLGQAAWKQHIMVKLFMWAVTDKQACSDLAAEWMFGKSAPIISIMPLPILCDKCKYDSHKAAFMRKELGLDDCFVVGHIGRMVYPKNHNRLIDIFHEVCKIKPSSRLVLIGSGELESEIKEKILRYGIEDKVLFLGQIENACTYLSAFDIFLMPSRYEGFPTVALESQANGLPCVLSDKITHSIALTDLIHFMSLDMKDEEWAKVAVNVNCNGNRASYNDLIREKYDVIAVAKKYEQLYSE